MKQYIKYTIPLFALAPVVAHAQTLQVFLKNFTNFLGNIIVPFLIVVAFLFIIYNAVRYFVFQGSNEEGREKAKALALYSVLAMVLITIFWGVINMIASSIGLDGKTAPTSDYVESST